MTSNEGFDTLSGPECLRLLAGQRLGRVVADAGSQPTVVPVRFALDGENVVFRAGEALAGIVSSAPRVAFEADNPHPADGWSVVVTGPAAEVSDGEVAPASLTAAGAPDDPTPTRLFRLTSEKVSGRQLLRPPLYVGGTVRTGVASVHPSHDAPPAGMVGDPLDCPSRPLPVETCRRLVATAEVGRLAILEDGEPGIFPVNFAVDGDAVVFRTAPGTKLESIARSAVAFEVDHLPAGSGTGWSVVLNGFAEEVTSAHHPGLREHLASLAVRPWAPGERIHFVRLVPSAVSGTRYGEASGAG